MSSTMTFSSMYVLPVRLILTSFLSAAAVFPLLAESSLPPLAVNNTPEQVAAAWGVPRDKIEKETLREERWVYDRGEVLFRDGRLAEWKVAAHPALSSHQSTNKATRPAPAAARPEDLSKVITELVDELPVEEAAPSGAGALPAMPALGQ